jgi:6-pyruvoyltetrahydropterin/6-carboxytetrahydropterin synthase
MPSKSSRRRTSTQPPKVLHGTVFITRQVHFNAAHRLHNPSKSQKWNEEQYGLCTNPHWHGHNYVLEVTLRGQPDAETGYLMDLSRLKKILQKTILGPCDHHNLNEDVSFLRGIIPSTENLTIAFWQQIEPHIPAPARLHCVRLYETPRNFADYYGPEVPA